MKSRNDVKWFSLKARSITPPVQNPAESLSGFSPRTFIGRVAGLTGAAAFTVLLCNKVVTWASGLLLATFLPAMALGQQASVPPTKPSSRLDYDVTAIAETYRTAVTQSDLSALMGLYSEDAVEMPFFRPAVSGRKAIREFYEGQFKGPAHVTSFTFRPTERSAHGDVAYDVGSYTRTMSTSVGTTEGSGSYMVLLKRSAGQWKIAYITYTCNCAPHSEPALSTP